MADIFDYTFIGGCGDACPTCACGSQRITWKSQFFPSCVRPMDKTAVTGDEQGTLSTIHRAVSAAKF